jgi:sRNA-binding regulator protein Hfq
MRRRDMTQQIEKPVKPKSNPTQEAPYKFGKGQEVRVTFLDGKSMTGTINQISRYHIVLEFEGKNEFVTVFKHAIKYIISKKSEVSENK